VTSNLTEEDPSSIMVSIKTPSASRVPTHSVRHNDHPLGWVKRSRKVFHDPQSLLKINLESSKLLKQIQRQVLTFTIGFDLESHQNSPSTLTS
jgi:hypothetical protein